MYICILFLPKVVDVGTVWSVVGEQLWHDTRCDMFILVYVCPLTASQYTVFVYYAHVRVLEEEIIIYSGPCVV